MTTSVQGFKILDPKQTGMMPEAPPCLLMGQGTPDGDLSPFKEAQKGTLYFQTDATDDESHIWQKVDEGNDDNDWVRLLVEGHALIDTSDIAANAGILGSQLADEARRLFATTREVFNIDNGSGSTEDQIILVPSVPITIVAARVVYIEATDTEGAADATVQIGTAIAGEQIVAAAALEVAKAIGDVTDLTIVDGAVAADELVAVRHTGIAATEAGQYVVQIEYTVDDAS
jgi:hypothetical protein